MRRILWRALEENNTIAKCYAAVLVADLGIGNLKAKRAVKARVDRIFRLKPQKGMVYSTEFEEASMAVCHGRLEPKRAKNTIATRILEALRFTVTPTQGLAYARREPKRVPVRNQGAQVLTRSLRWFIYRDHWDWEQSTVRRAAVKALADMGDPTAEVLKALEETAASDPNETVREASAKALRDLGD